MKNIIGIKLCLVLGYPVVSMLLCGMVTGSIFFVTERFFSLCAAAPLAPKTLLWIFLSLLCHAFLSGAVSLFSLWIGFLKKSIPTAIVTGVITVTVLCQILSAAFIYHPILYILLCVAVTISILIVRNLLYQVENMEV